MLRARRLDPLILLCGPDERRRYLRERHSYDDRVKRTAFWPAKIAIAKPNAHVVAPEISQHFGSGLRKLRDDLNDADLSRETREDGDLIAPRKPSAAGR